jgi:hypothetical protein
MNRFQTKTNVTPGTPDVVLITRKIRSSTDKTAFTINTIYNGPAKVQYKPGAMVYNPSGATPTYDAMAYIDAVSGVVPAVLDDDVLTVNGDAFVVISVQKWISGALPHIEVLLRRGTITYTPPPR